MKFKYSELRFFSTVFFLMAFCFVCEVEAVFVASSTPNSNNTQPTGDQGWSSMGIYNNASAVYVGQGWFITAGHLGNLQTSVKLGGTNYSIDDSSWTNIKNTDGTYADIRMFQVEQPGAITVPGTPIYTKPLSLNDGVTMIGYGRDVSSVVSQQTITKYYEGNTSTMKWAPNDISGFNASYSGAGYTSDSFITTIAPDAGQALDKDSGGGVFVNDEGEYRLAGIMIAAVRFSDDGGTTIYAKYDSRPSQSSSTTTAVNLSSYQEQINPTIPEPTIAILIGLTGFLSLLVWRIRNNYLRQA